MRRQGAISLVLLSLAVYGCGDKSEVGSVPTVSESVAPTAAPAGDWTYVALGDSWPEGAHCNGCRPFPELHAEALQTKTGRTIEYKNLAGQAQPGFEALGGGMASLLDALQTNEAFRTAVSSGDIIVIATGPNEGGAVTDAVAAGTCGGIDDLDCIRDLGRTWAADLDGILDEIDRLRAGQPTAIRLVNAANAFIGSTEPGLDEATTTAFFEELTVAMRENCSAHGAVCLDVRPILNGPGLDQPVDDSTIDSMVAVADALTLIGVSELD